MLRKKRTLVAAAVAATAALTMAAAVPAQAAAPAGDNLAPDRNVTVAPASAAAATALATIQDHIAQYVATHGTTYSFGSYLDATTGRIVLDTDAPADLVRKLTDLSGRATTAQQRAANRIQVRRATITDAWHRRDDIPAFYGGGGIRSGSICSSGFPVQNSAGTRFMVTAGHCYPNGATVLTESSNYTYGTVSNRRLASATGHSMDVELIGGKSYAAQIFTGGTTSTTSIPVVSAGQASVGYQNYCHSGRTTGEQCGHTATSITGQVCTGTGCKSPVIVYTGGTIQQSGDSGGPFYAQNSSGAYIRGHVIASSSTTGYVQPWIVISSELNVSVVTN